jgi:hypothetical protein
VRCRDLSSDALLRTKFCGARKIYDVATLARPLKSRVPQNLGIWRSTVAKNTAFMPVWALVSRQGYRRQMLDDAQKQPFSVRRDPETKPFLHRLNDTPSPPRVLYHAFVLLFFCPSFVLIYFAGCDY